jgi:hypothetical protein
VIFYLGTHLEAWLARVDVPLFVSYRKLGPRKTLPAARTRWALDSGGFSELLMFGEYRTSEDAYADNVARIAEQVGHLDWAVAQDWVSTPEMTAKTGLTLDEHQHRTIESVCRLRARLSVPIAPVLHGQTTAGFVAHAAMYEAAGIDLVAEPVVAVGSLAIRNGSSLADETIRTLAGAGLRLHGLGVKTSGLARYHGALASADSMAWSYAARRAPRLPGCTGHKNCQNCLRYALEWRTRILDAGALEQYQLSFAEL